MLTKATTDFQKTDSSRYVYPDTDIEAHSYMPKGHLSPHKCQLPVSTQMLSHVCTIYRSIALQLHTCHSSWSKCSKSCVSRCKGDAVRQMHVYVLMWQNIQWQSWDLPNKKDWKSWCVPTESFSPVLLSSPAVSLAAQTPWHFLEGPRKERQISVHLSASKLLCFSQESTILWACCRSLTTWAGIQVWARKLAFRKSEYSGKLTKRPLLEIFIMEWSRWIKITYTPYTPKLQSFIFQSLI